MSDQLKLPRPTVLTPEVQATILDALRRGNYLSTACEVAGIAYRTLLYWKDQERFADFFTSIKKYERISEASALEDLSRGNPGWQARAWFLERRFPNRWARKEPAKSGKDSDQSAPKPRIDIPDDDDRFEEIQED